MNRIRGAALALVMAIAGLGAPVAAHADTRRGGADNVVMVNNSNDGALAARSRAVVSHDPGPTVGNQNYAQAYAHDCTGCRTVAAAVQVVLVEGATTNFTPANAAVAVNEKCYFCQTFAYANQYVFSPRRPVRLSDDAREQISEINGQIAEVVRSQESFPEMSAQLDSLSGRLQDIVRAEIARAGTSAEEKPFRDVQQRDS